MTTITSIAALIVPAIALFIYEQRYNGSYLRINANSRGRYFTIDLENVNHSLAKIEKIEFRYKTPDGDIVSYEWLEEDMFKGEIKLFNTDNCIFGVEDHNYKMRMFSNLTNDVIAGGVKHHMFRCEVDNMDDLKTVWESISNCSIGVTYKDIYGFTTFIKRKCKSHFDQDYNSFKLAVRNRKM